MAETANRRYTNRIPATLKTYYSFDGVEGVGVLADVSYSGALIADISTRPEIGTTVVLCVCLKSPLADGKVTAFELSGVVVRHSSTGFAVTYADDHKPDVHRLLDTARAIMASPR